MQTATELNDQFAMPDVLSFEEFAGLVIARVSTEACTATLFLQGAHLVHWQPTGEEPVLFLSEKSIFETGKAIRGGVPVVFPWFGARTGERTDGPSHGFARLSTWNLAFAAMTDDELHLTLTLAPNDLSRELGYDKFRLAYEVALGRTLTIRLSVANEGDEPLRFEEALHSYLSVGDAEQIQIGGLGGAEYLDKTDAFARERQEEDFLTLCGETDRAYMNTPTTVGLQDPVMTRQLAVAKRSSLTTVVWNPWAEAAAKLPDMAPDGWRSMVCIETANAGDNAVTLEPGETHAMEAHLFVVQPEELRY